MADETTQFRSLEDSIKLQPELPLQTMVEQIPIGERVASDLNSKSDAAYEKMVEQMALLTSAIQSLIKVKFDVDINFDSLCDSSSSFGNKVLLEAEAPKLFDEMPKSVSPVVIADQPTLMLSETDNDGEIDAEEGQFLCCKPEVQSDSIMNIQEVSTKNDGSFFMVRDTHFLLLKSPYADEYVERVLQVNHGFWVVNRILYEFEIEIMSLRSKRHGSNVPVYFSPVDCVIFSFDPGGYGFSFLFAEAATLLRELEGQLLLVRIDVERYTKGTSVFCVSGPLNMFLLVDETFQHYCGDFVSEEIIGAFVSEEIMIYVDIPVNWIYTLIERNELLMKHILLSSSLGSRPFLFSLRIPMVLHNLYENQLLGNDPINCVSNMLSVPLEHHWFQILRLTNSGYYLEAASIVVSFVSTAHGALDLVALGVMINCLLGIRKASLHSNDLLVLLLCLRRYNSVAFLHTYVHYLGVDTHLIMHSTSSDPFYHLKFCSTRRLSEDEFGGIEAEATMLGQPMSMVLPCVVGLKLSGKLRNGVTATDLVLTVTQMMRKHGVVVKFVEFSGPGMAELSLADRATIANMFPEYGATMGFFPVDHVTLGYLKLTGRSEETNAMVEGYLRSNKMFIDYNEPQRERVYLSHLEFALTAVKPCISGPKRPHDRVPLKKMKADWHSCLDRKPGFKGLGVSEQEQDKLVKFSFHNQLDELKHGSVVIAAITSCTNTSNPSVMLETTVVAKKACEMGLEVKPWVQTSLGLVQMW